MKLPLLIITALFFSIALQAREANTVKAGYAQKNETQHSSVFIENKGQITDQYCTSRN